jgi:uncharacterized protein YutE (UPF0331/DUF86 family)
MTRMPKFRNIIVHDYARIDPEIILGILHRNVDDFRRFSKEIIQFLDKS